MRAPSTKSRSDAGGHATRARQAGRDAAAERRATGRPRPSPARSRRRRSGASRPRGARSAAARTPASGGVPASTASIFATAACPARATSDEFARLVVDDAAVDADVERRPLDAMAVPGLRAAAADRERRPGRCRGRGRRRSVRRVRRRRPRRPVADRTPVSCKRLAIRNAAGPGAATRRRARAADRIRRSDAATGCPCPD